MSKGKLIAHCGALGVDWRTLDLSGYLEALEAHNEAHDPEAGKGEIKSDMDRLAKFHRAHGRDGGKSGKVGSIGKDQGAQRG